MLPSIRRYTAPLGPPSARTEAWGLRPRHTSYPCFRDSDLAFTDSTPRSISLPSTVRPPMNEVRIFITCCDFRTNNAHVKAVVGRP